MEKLHPLSKYLLSFIFILLTIELGYVVQQSDFSDILLYGSIFFLLYWYVFQNVFHQKTVYFFIGLAILLRLILIFGIPNLSDDIFRFVWDGRLIASGINPFDHLPSYYREVEQQIPGINQNLFTHLNSPEYFTIYPPVCQGIFALSSFIFPESIWASSLLMKFIFVVFEAGTILLIIQLLKAFQLPQKNALLYALNPLIIIELTGNLHFEGPMIFFLCLSIWLLVKSRWWLSAVAMTLAIATKLLPLIFLPLLIRRLGWKKSFYYFSIIGIGLLLLFAPIFNKAFISNFGESLNLYFQKFEFNASIYYAVRYIGFQVKGYNLIQFLGPILGIISTLFILSIAWREKYLSMKQLPKAMLFCITTYLFFSTTIHPWYVSLPLVLCIFTPFRFPVLWSGLIWLTYINYSYGEYAENFWMVGVEYLLVFSFLIIEWYNNNGLEGNEVRL